MVKIAIFVKNEALGADCRLLELKQGLDAMGAEFYLCGPGDSSLEPGTQAVLSVGGDGTFLSAARLAGEPGVPVLGINLGRMGFLADASVPDALEALKCDSCVLEQREILSVDSPAASGLKWPFAVNEVSVSRRGPEMLGVDVCVDGKVLPTYWADGLLVATSSGSTAYSLSVGGPICTPESRVLIVSPIAPHNLNLRPLIVPDTSEVTISLQPRSSEANLTVDNQSTIIYPGQQIHLSLAQFSLKRLRLPQSEFIGALKSKLFWGEDVRNK